MIESLNSPHVGRVKALISLKKERLDSHKFIAEGVQGIREAILFNGAIDTLYLTTAGAERLHRAGIDYSQVNQFEVSDKVADAMSDAMTSQGIIAICNIKERQVSELNGKNIVYLYEIQDPGNAGTILRTADAMGIEAIVTSPGSVDLYSPKVVRATAGSLWHTPIYSGIEIGELAKLLPSHKLRILDGSSEKRIYDVDFSQPAIWIFGNEARGIKEKIIGAERVSISMPGNAESLNLAAAAAIVMHEISRG